MMPRPPTGHTSDSDLVLRSGSEPAVFAQLYDRHAPELHRFTARRVGSQVAEDLVAETFLAAFRRRDSYDPSQPDARPWLYGIATNLIGHHRRSEMRMLRAYVRTPAPEPEADATASIDERLTATAAQPAIAAALAELPSQYRDVLLLVAWTDFSYEQVAAALGLPLGTVRSRLNRARQQVCAALASSAPELLLEIGDRK
jgi:RNA polymerase sigma factor (sigma-70 family)